MTRAVRDRVLKDANGDIGDHLRNHIHLTNCIHLKNHMHKHSPMSNDRIDRSFISDLMVLQRSRSLRDPSASSPLWHSPLTTDMLAKSGDMASLVGRRMSTGVDRHRVGRRISRSSPKHESVAASNVKIGEGDKVTRGVEVTSERSSMSAARDGRKGKKKQTSEINESSCNNERPDDDENGNDFSRDIALANPEQIGRNSHAMGIVHSQEAIPKTLEEQLSEVPVDCEDVASSNIHLHGETSEKTEPRGRASYSGLNRVRRNKFRRMKRTQASAAKKDKGAPKEPSVASNSSVRGLGHQVHRIEEQDDFGENNVSRAPRNGCGIPWNWSRIHHRGKSLIDMAGRSFACGLSDSREKRGGSMSQGRHIMDLPRSSNCSNSGSKYDAEVLPLLVDGYGSQETSENAAWEHDYSGELGIFANSLLKQEMESDTSSESRSGDLHKFRGDRHGMHLSLTQKYMPKSFRDLVGQNLVVQALSNAVMRRKMALLYVFYGPHGTGKTSCARILARALNCQSPEHPKPCGSCTSCITHDLGKSRSIKEVGPVSNLDFESIMDLLESMILSEQGSHYRVFIFDDCDTLSAECWSAISKVIDRAPRRVVFMLVCSSIDILPHIILSRCQKFFFPKLKDADIIYALQWIATKEGLEIDKGALKLIASRSDGSLRDAEMTLEQLSLLGQRISVTLVQELVGLVSDEKLVDLLDLALSADTVNTVKNLRELMETGAEPLTLMSQLATVITDILAGSYDFTKGSRRRRFFKQSALSKEDMEKLRQALKTLSEAEKQLRTSNDKLTWLTAGLLQLAPDRQYMWPSSSADTSFNYSPLFLNDKATREVARKSNSGQNVMSHGRGLDSVSERLRNASGVAHGATNSNARSVDKRRHVSSRITTQQISSANTDADRGHHRISFGKDRAEMNEIWLDVLDKIRITSIKEFLYQEGKLISVSYNAAAPTVQLGFSSQQIKSTAEKCRTYILQAFESTFGCPVLVEMRAESRKGVAPVGLPTFEGGSSQMNTSPQLTSENCAHPQNGSKLDTSEIVEVAATPREADRRTPEASQLVLEGASQKLSNMASHSQRSRPQELNQCRSLVRSKVSLAHVIQQTEGFASHNSWTKCKAVSIADKLEQDNLRLEPSTRSLLCWKVSRATRRKFSHLKIRTRRSRSLLKLVSCGKCISTKSPR